MTGDDRDGNGSPSLRTRLRTGVENFTARWRGHRDALGRAAERSRLDALVRHMHGGTIARRLQAGAQRSRVVRWLTREPDPDVVVIDLTETWTVGPILRALDPLAGATGRFLRSTGLAATATNTATVLRRNAVPAASGVLLGYVLATLALTWSDAEPLWLLALSIAGVAGLLGLGVDRSRAVVADSRIRRWLVALLEPPTAEDGQEGTR